MIEEELALVKQFFSRFSAREAIVSAYKHGEFSAVAARSRLGEL